MVFAVLILLMGSGSSLTISNEIKPFEPPSDPYLAIVELNYYRNKTQGDKEILQIWDNFDVKFSYSPSLTFDYKINLFMYDSDTRTWEEGSVNEREGESKCGLFDRYQPRCDRSITLNKPLIGLDLLKPSGCREGEFKKQPYTSGRWGYLDSGREETACYMVVISTRGQSVSKLYPDKCVQEMLIIEQSIFEEYSRREKRNTQEYDIIDFKIIENSGNQKFICKFEFLQYSIAVNLQNDIPTTVVKVYYKQNNASPWGSYLLELDWKNFNENHGFNRYKSKVSNVHLVTQGVDVNNCFKCEVSINGLVFRMCLGDCTCN